MGGAVVGRESVGQYIDLLESRYGRFAVNQTTVTVPAAGYERARERVDRGFIDAYVRVWNDDGEALHFRCEDAFALSDGDATLEASVRAAVRSETGVDATIAGVDSVTIAGIRNEDDADAAAVYRLLVLFDADHRDGDLESTASNGECDGQPTTPFPLQ